LGEVGPILKFADDLLNDIGHLIFGFCFSLNMPYIYILYTEFNHTEIIRGRTDSCYFSYNGKHNGQCTQWSASMYYCHKLLNSLDNEPSVAVNCPTCKMHQLFPTTGSMSLQLQPGKKEKKKSQ